MSDIPQFEEFPKIARLNRRCVITEKLDGTNASVLITEDGDVFPGSRQRFVTVEADNFGWARFVTSNLDTFRLLGPGRHYGEWWGSGVGRRQYGLTNGERRFSLFNTGRWNADNVPDGLYVVPVLYDGLFATGAVDACVETLRERGSLAAPGFMQPEGVIVWHEAARLYFKVTLEKDAEHKSAQKGA